YRYRFDESEIAASRRVWILPVTAAFIAFALLMIIVGLVGAIINVHRVYLLAASVCEAASGIGVYVTSTSILAGRAWARWVGLLIAILIILGVVIFGGWWFVSGEPGPILLLFLPALAASIALVFQLLMPKTREWFRFASSLRAEHRKRRKSETAT